MVYFAAKEKYHFIFYLEILTRILLYTNDKYSFKVQNTFHIYKQTFSLFNKLYAVSTALFFLSA